jgi:hypothetical protein
MPHAAGAEHSAEQQPEISPAKAEPPSAEISAAARAEALRKAKGKQPATETGSAQNGNAEDSDEDVRENTVGNDTCCISALHTNWRWCLP